MYSSIYQKALFPFYESFLRGRNTLKYLEELEKNQWLPEEKIKEFQWSELKKLLRHAYENVPFYTEFFRESGFATPDGIKDPDDFGKLPIIDKPTIRANWNNMVAKNIPKILTKSTGGSTGEPLYFGYTRDSYEWRRAISMRGYSWAGYKEGDRVVYLWGVPAGGISYLENQKLKIYHLVQNARYFDVFNLSPQTMESYFRAMERFRPKHIVAYAFPMYYFTKFISDMGWHTFPVESIIIGAEKIDKDQTQFIGSAFGCPVFNTYGCREFMLIAGQCEYRNEMHVSADNLYVEILRGDAPAGESEMGEVVVTDLHNYGMPFIRYRTGDVAIESKRLCQCGRGLPLIADVEGRVVDMITAPNGKIIPGQYFIGVVRTTALEEVERFRIVQENREKVLFRIVPKTEIPQAKLEIMREKVQRMCGTAMEVEFEFVDEIPLASSGKHRIVISKVPVSL